MVRLHIPKNRCKRSASIQGKCEHNTCNREDAENPLNLIYHHRVYRELKFFTQNISSEHIVRYFNSWFEELDPEERRQEAEYRTQYRDMLRRRQERKKQRRELKAKRSRVDRMIKNRQPSVESLGTSNEKKASKLASSKRQKWKTKIIGNSQDSSGYDGTGSSIQSKKSSMQRLSFQMKSSKRHRRSKLVSSDGANRPHQSLFTGGKSSAHEFTIPEKVNEENNEETENEDVKNESEFRK